MRDRFDALLVTAAQQRGGVALATGTVVQRVVPRADAVELVTDRGTFAAQFVIAADGVNSVVARQTDRPALRNITGGSQGPYGRW